MKRLVILSACLAISLAGWAQGNRNDSLRMDSIIHSLPDVMVKGNRPIVKVKGAALTYDLPQLIKNHPVDNAYEAIKQLPGVSEQDDALTLNAQSVTVMIDGKATTMTSEQLYSLLKTIPTSRIANAEVIYSREEAETYIESKPYDLIFTLAVAASKAVLTENKEA